jgi:2',3'-cyclic-nucleotide 2'-phosphodiesterase/3'-nucleotidase
MGVTYEINPAAPVGSRIQNLCYQGKPVQDEDVFTMCLNNYRYSGAGGYPMYPQCPLVREINTEMVELIMEYFHQNPMVEVNSNV